jgi:hypothetical protein
MSRAAKEQKKRARRYLDSVKAGQLPIAGRAKFARENQSRKQMWGAARVEREVMEFCWAQGLDIERIILACRVAHEAYRATENVEASIAAGQKAAA